MLKTISYLVYIIITHSLYEFLLYQHLPSYLVALTTSSLQEISFSFTIYCITDVTEKNVSYKTEF